MKLFFAVSLFVSFIGYQSEATTIKQCVDNGIAYFKEIESYPYLSSGRSAVTVATERCNRNVHAFDGLL